MSRGSLTSGCPDSRPPRPQQPAGYPLATRTSLARSASTHRRGGGTLWPAAAMS